MTTSRIPAEHLVPLVRNYLANYECMEDGVSTRIPSKVRILAEQAGISPHYIADMMRKPRKTVKFDVADRLLCAMGMPGAWLDWPLIAFYYAAALTPISRSRRLELVA